MTPSSVCFRLDIARTRASKLRFSTGCQGKMSPKARLCVPAVPCPSTSHSAHDSRPLLAGGLPSHPGWQPPLAIPAAVAPLRHFAELPDRHHASPRQTHACQLLPGQYRTLRDGNPTISHRGIIVICTIVPLRISPSWSRYPRSSRIMISSPIGNT